MSNPKNIYYEAALGEPNTVVLHIPVHYPGEYQQGDELNPKKRLAVLKRALHRIKDEIKSAEHHIEAEAYEKSGQITLEQAIENAKNKFIPDA
jgi:hypothetical protein